MYGDRIWLHIKQITKEMSRDIACRVEIIYVVPMYIIVQQLISVIEQKLLYNI